MATTQADGLNESMCLEESFVDGADFKENNFPGMEGNHKRRYSMLHRFTSKLDPRRHSIAGKLPSRTLAGKSTQSVSSLSGSIARRNRPSKKRVHRQDLVRTYFGTPPKLQRSNKDWAAQASPTVVGRMDKNEKKRQEANYEVTNGEAQYVDCLEHIDAVFSKTLLANKYLTPAEHASIFSNLSDILKKHQELNSALTTARGSAGIANMGEIFSKWWKSWEPEKAYGIYCSNLAYGKHVLRNVLKTYKANKNSNLDEYLKRATELKQSQRQMLHDMLDAPRRRLQNYNLLFKAVRKYTTATDPDLPYLDMTIKLISTTCSEVDKVVRDNGRDRVVAIQESIDFSHSLQQINLVDDNVPLLMEGEAFLKDSKPCKVFLFQHMLFVTKESRHIPGKSVIVNRPIQITHLEIDDGCEPRSSFKGKTKMEHNESDCVLTIRNCDPTLMKNSKNRVSKIQRVPSFTGKAMTIKFGDKTERDEWVNAIETLKQEQTGDSVITFV